MYQLPYGSRPPQVPDPNTMNKVHYQYGIVYVHTCVGNAYFGQINSIEYLNLSSMPE